MKRVNVAAVVAVLLSVAAFGLVVWDHDAQSDRALVVALLALVAAVLSFRE